MQVLRITHNIMDEGLEFFDNACIGGYMSGELGLTTCMINGINTPCWDYGAIWNNPECTGEPINRHQTIPVQCTEPYEANPIALPTQHDIDAMSPTEVLGLELFCRHLADYFRTLTSATSCDTCSDHAADLAGALEEFNQYLNTELLCDPTEGETNVEMVL